MEKEANCGIEAHQHDDSCYTEELICEIPESEGHHHTDACYDKVLSCGKEVHIHSVACYEADPMSESAVAASTSSAAAATTSANSVSSEGMILSFEDKAGEPAETDEPAGNDRLIDNVGSIDKDGLGETDGSSAISSVSSDETKPENTEEVAYGSENAGTGNTEAVNTALTDMDNGAAASTGLTVEDHYIPQLDTIDFSTVLNSNTGIYYYHVADGETVEDSSAIPAENWKRIPNNTDYMENMDDVELGSNDFLRVYLSYTIPVGSLNSTNPVARWRLPSNLHLTDPQVKTINENVNGIAGQYVDMSTLEITDPDKYKAYLGLEAVEGTRRPNEAVEDYLAEHARKTDTGAVDTTEYISAVVRVENVYDIDGIYGKKGAYLGQDLIFTFVPYSIEKNQHEYDSTGQPTKAGQEIEGWLTLDLNLRQVDFGEPEITSSTVKAYDTENVDGHSEDDHGIDNHTKNEYVEDEQNENDHDADTYSAADDEALEGGSEEEIEYRQYSWTEFLYMLDNNHPLAEAKLYVSIYAQ